MAWAVEMSCGVILSAMISRMLELNSLPFASEKAAFRAVLVEPSLNKTSTSPNGALPSVGQVFSCRKHTVTAILALSQSPDVFAA